MKHLAQSSANCPPNCAALGDSGIIQRLVTSGIWDERGDAMTEVVQVGAIGVVKHLCNSSGVLIFSFLSALPSTVLMTCVC